MCSSSRLATTFQTSSAFGRDDANGEDDDDENHHDDEETASRY